MDVRWPMLVLHAVCSFCCQQLGMDTSIIVNGLVFGARISRETAHDFTVVAMCISIPSEKQLVIGS